MNYRLVSLAVALGAAVVALAGPAVHGIPRAAFAAPVPDAVLARGKIKRVVVIVMENRTFDNVFGGDTVVAGHPTPYPGADAVVPAPIARMMHVTDFTMTTPPHASPLPGPNNWHNVYQCVASGGFTNASWQKNAQSPMSCSGWHFTSPNGPFWYLDRGDRAVYAAIARQYEMGDAFFAPASSDSFPGHQFIVSGRSNDADGDQVADQPLYVSPSWMQGQYTTGCADAPSPSSAATPAILVPVLGPTASPWAIPTTRGFEGECYDVPTFADRLAAKQKIDPTMTWTHYATVTTIPAPYSGEQPFNGFINNPTWWNASWPAAAQVITDGQNGTIPRFAWVKPPCTHASDHPGTNDGGPSWVQSVVNAIGSNRQQWNETAIFVIWDDWGGFYDHVPPPSPRAWDGQGPGLRTPFLVISPYVKPGNVAHGIADYGSILRFVESLNGIESLHAMDEHSPDLTGFFDFSTARPFAAVTASPTMQWTTACPPGSAQSREPFRD